MTTTVSTVKRLTVVASAVVGAGGLAMLPAAFTGAIYAEWGDALALLAAAGVSVAVGLAGRRLAGSPGSFTVREGFAAVALSWFVLIGFGVLPYLFAGSFTGPTNALFETTAGFTTTGATVLDDPSVLSHAMLIWRATTQWVGGMGIIVLSIAILPMLGAGGVELARAESPGPEPDRLTPRFRDTAKRLWWIYVGLTAIEAVLLTVGEMSLFQGIAHSLTTMPSGGFGTEPDSLASFNAYTHWVVIAFMVMTGASFALHFRALTHPKAYLENKEFLGYISIVAGGALAIGLGTWSMPTAAGRTVRDAIFSSAALVTTTGYTTVDWAAWAPGVLMVVLVLMFLGGMAGSTAGGIKTYRIGVLYKTIGSSLKRIIYPSIVSVQRFGGKAVEPRLVHGVVAFFILYVGIFFGGAVLLAFFEPALDLVTIGSAAASAVSNIGPALGDVGPASSYAALGADSKWLLGFMMVVGRLEIFPVVILLTRRWWRR